MAGPCSVGFLQRHAGEFKAFCSFSASSLISWFTKNMTAGTCESQPDFYPWDQDHQSQVIVSTEVGMLGPEGAASCSS